jgi:hypothetical protein
MRLDGSARKIKGCEVEGVSLISSSWGSGTGDDGLGMQLIQAVEKTHCKLRICTDNIKVDVSCEFLK